MYSYPYVRNYQKINVLFEEINKAGVPDKFTYRFLSKLGFASSRDRDMMQLLKTIKLIDANGKPSEQYNKIRNPEEIKKSLGELIYKSYKNLFDLSSKLPDVSEKTINGYFGTLTGDDHTVCEIYTKTFLALCALADFSSWLKKENMLHEKASTSPNKLEIVFNINLPSTENEKVYEAIFKNLKALLIRQQ